MNRVTNTHTAPWLSNPSLLWLPFALPFFFGLWGVAIGAGVLLIIVLKWRQLSHSWRSYLFLPLIVLLLSIGISHLWVPKWVPEWGLLAVALSAGWLWRVEYILSGESPLGIEEWLFSARLFGLGSLIVLLLFLLFPIDLPWLPGVFIIAGVVWHHFRVRKGAEREQFCCPVSNPLVRMAIVKGDQVWLTDSPFTGCYVEGEESHCHAPTYRDHPLTSCVHHDETPEEALTRAFVASGLQCDSSPRFLLKYQHAESRQSRRMIYLFVLNLKPEEKRGSLELRGHFYSPEQIEKRLEKGLFSPLFSEEYTYLKNTLLRVNVLNP